MTSHSSFHQKIIVITNNVIRILPTSYLLLATCYSQVKGLHLIKGGETI